VLAHIVETYLRPIWGLWLMIFFLGIVFYAFRPKNKQRLEEHGSIPLKDDNEER
jgi:cytochrome c oxidase cbb3-type subunit 4